MLLSFIVSPVAAQVPTTRLFFNPTPLQIDTTISPTGVVSLEVADGVDIFAFDLFVQYDPSLLRVSQVTLGDFLGEGLFCMDQVNDPGLVHYSCTRFGVDTGVSGSGVLLELTFEALGQGGDTTLTLDGSALYESQDAFLIDATLEDGAVSVRPYLTYVPLILTASGQGMEAMP
ncbi:MAG: cohesin domain-containing protein [Anaerolineaceae bacterium]